MSRHETALNLNPGTRAGFAGASGGTIMIAFASTLSSEGQLREILILSAPSVTVLLSVLWVWIQIKIINFLRRREVFKYLDNAISSIEEIINNPSTSGWKRKKFEKVKENLKLRKIEWIMKQVESIEVVSASQINQILGEKSSSLDGELTRLSEDTQQN